MTATGTTDLIEAHVDLAIKAGEEILVVYDAGGGAVTKTDGSPVTEADTRAEAVILAGLAELTPEIPVLAEEKVAAGDVPDVSGGPFWLVDPLDGTKEFISRNGEFTVNIALVDDGVPVVGVVHLPALGSTYIGSRDGGAQRRDADGAAELHVRPVPEDGYDVLTSRSHSDQATEEFLAKITVRDRVSAGSSLKFCRVAEGSADLYPRLGRTMEWDTAAGHAVVLAAGGVVCTLADEPLRYGKDGHDNPAFVAYGSARPPL
jgi:3'(2'), 5'-bisphosphate nucleotidase